ncbi:MAG: hypothetical protein ACYC6N_30045 [Pirellulaceae bacterium]
MRWSAVLLLPALGIAGLVIAEADEQVVPSLQTPAHDATPWQPPVPYPVSVVPVQQVLLHIKLLELNQENLRRLGLDFSQTQLLQGLPGLNHSVEVLRKEGQVRVLAEPTLVTVMERRARFRSGGEVKLWEIGPDGKPEQRAEHLGTCVDFVPRLIDERELRIELRVEVSEVDCTKTVVVAGKENPAIHKRVVDTALRVKLGEISALSCPVHTVGGAEIDSASTVIVMLVTVEECP